MNNTSRTEIAIQAGIVLFLVAAGGVGFKLGYDHAQAPPAPPQPVTVIVAAGGVTCVPASACRVMPWPTPAVTRMVDVPR